MKRTLRYTKKGKNGRSRIIKCNRPDWRKKVIGRKGMIKFKHRGTKIKSKEFEKIEL